MKKVAVVLSGCGFKDGSEITEAVSVLIALSECGAHVQCFAPDVEFESFNHLTGDTSGRRNVLVESARIARGHIQSLKNLEVNNFDALALPGGYGAATTLCQFATQGSRSKVLPELATRINEFYNQQKPILAACIAPSILALVLGAKKITLTIGNDEATAREIEKTGAIHEDCPVDEFVSDREHRIVTVPAYMYEASPFEVFKGIQKAVRELVEMS